MNYHKGLFGRLLSATLSACLIITVVPFVATPVAGAATIAAVGTATYRAVTFTSSTTGFAAGTGGTIVKTTDGGATWYTVRSEGTYDFTGISFYDANNGRAVTSVGVLFATTDAGVTWTLVDDDVGDGWWGTLYIGDIDYLSSTQGYLAGGTTEANPGMVWRDYGGSISGLNPDLKTQYFVGEEANDGNDLFYGTDWPSTTRGWAVGHNRRLSKPCIWRYESGEGWREQTQPLTSSMLNDVSFGSTTQGVAVGASGNALYTTDAGVTWTAATTGITNTLYGVSVNSSGRAWFVGTSGVVYTSTDFGQTWTSQSAPVAGATLHDVVALSSTAAVVVGANGQIAYTTNSGSTWTAASSVAPISNLASTTHPSQSSWYTAASADFTWSSTGSSPTFAWKLDQVSNTDPGEVDLKNSTPSASSVAVASTGTYYFHVRGKDSYGQWGTTAHRTVKRDATNPTASDNVNSNGYDGSASVTITGSDAHSGVKEIRYSTNGGTSYTTKSGASATVSFTSPGTYTLKYYVVDNALSSGNKSATITKTVTVRTTETDATPKAIEGGDRYATAVNATLVNFPGAMSAGPDGYKSVVIASGENWPDALAASGLAGTLRAPLLLTQAGQLPSVVESQIKTLGANRAIIIGGTAAISPAVASALAKATGSTPLRYSDSNRYLTAATVAERTIGVPGRTAWDGTAFVATGGNFPDALAAAPVAAKMGWPLYLADPAGMQGSLVTRMKAAGVKKVIVLGGTSAVSAATMNQLTAAGMPATRWSGSDRYDTARVVATNSLGAYSGLTVGKLALATGENFPDALAGGVMQGLSGSVMLLSNGQTLSAPTAEMLSANKGKVSELRFLGGTSVLSTAVRQAALARVNP